MKKLTVIGGGNGGQAMAGYFAMNDEYEVTIFDYFKETIASLKEKKEINLSLFHFFPTSINSTR